MRFGVCSWTLDQDLPTMVAFLKSAGFDGVELMGDLAVYTPGEVNAALGASGLQVLSVTPQNVDLAHPDPAVRAQAVEYYLRLLDFAAAVGAPVAGCHGAVGRVRALSGEEAEGRWFREGVQRIAEYAARLGLCLALETLNRYESHLLNTAGQAIQFVDGLGEPNVGILLDAYHMNIEEQDPGAAILDAGRRLFLFHVADSNRQAVGRGHTDFLAVCRALQTIDYDGDILVECTAAGPDPFTPAKGPGWRDEVCAYAVESLRLLKAYTL